MKRFFHFVSLFIIAALFCGSCEKQKTAEPLIKAVEYRIHKIIVTYPDGAIDTEHFIYNSLNQLISVNYNNSTGLFAKAMLFYNNSQISTMQVTRQNNQTNEFQTVFLADMTYNSSQQLSALTMLVLQPEGGYLWGDTIHFVYNADGTINHIPESWNTENPDLWIYQDLHFTYSGEQISGGTAYDSTSTGTNGNRAFSIGFDSLSNPFTNQLGLFLCKQFEHLPDFYTDAGEFPAYFSKYNLNYLFGAFDSGNGSFVYNYNAKGYPVQISGFAEGDWPPSPKVFDCTIMYEEFP